MAKKKNKIKDEMEKLVGVAVSVNPIMEKDGEKDKRKKYQEGKEVKTYEETEIPEDAYGRAVNYVDIQFGKIVDNIENYNADNFGHTLGMIGSDSYFKSDQVEDLVRKSAKLYNKKITEHFTPNVADNLLFTEENIKDTLEGNYGIDRDLRAEGGEMDSQMTAMMMPTEETEEMDMLPDNQMEDQHLDFIINESLDNEEEMYLMEQLQADERLSMIFEKIMDTATEFSGSGPVEGLGTEVSDSIPARLSDGEFVMTAKATDEIGADNLERMMKNAEEASDNRQRVAMGGEIEKKVDRFGKPIDEDLTAEEIKRSMLSVNPRLR